jgi:hypothetical protein
MLRVSPRLVAAVTLLTFVPLGVANASVYRRYVSADQTQEVPAPPNPTAGAGATGVVDFNTDTDQVSINVTFFNMNGAATLSHFHGFAAPGVSAGVRVNLTPFIVNTTPGNGTVIGTIAYPAADEANILAGLYYLNIHNTANPAGQVRDQMVLFQLPATNPVGWIALGSLILMAGAFFIVRRRQTALA